MKKSLLFLIYLSFCLGACDQTPPLQTLTLQFKTSHEKQSVNCESGDVSLTDLRFYIHAIELLDTNGQATPMVLHEDGQQQTDNVVLLDFENGQGVCRNGSAETYTTITSDVPAGSYQGLRFRIGVPFELNHQNPVQAKPPLNYSTMHWHWQAGYKFMRFGVKSGESSFWFHLGSTGCQGSVTHVTGCERGNRPMVEFNTFDTLQDHIIIDMATMLQSVDISQHSKCMSSPESSSCIGVFEVLGLDMETGEPVQSAPLFKRGKRP
ncbi:MAG: MbnP family copper-binding protein [Pseudomonadota bacterium]